MGATWWSKMRTTCAATPVTWLLLFLNTLVFVVVSWQGKVVWAGATNSELLREWVLVPAYMYVGDCWVLLTSGFIHFGIMHLALNMLALWMLGGDVEKALGSWRFLMLYVVSLLAGSAGVLLLSTTPMAMTAGASGAIFGLLGAELIIVLRLKLRATPIFVVLLINGALGAALPGISWQAHLGGFVAGTLMTTAFVFVPRWVAAARKGASLSQRSADLVGWGGAVVVTVLVMVALVAGISVAIGETSQLIIPG